MCAFPDSVQRTVLTRAFCILLGWGPLAGALAAERGTPPKMAGSPDEAGRARIEIAGEKSFSESELRSVISEQIDSIRQSGLTRARADDAAFFLELHYRRRGYAQADVRYEILGGSRLLLTVSEGPNVQLGEVRFRGNESYDEATLRDYIVGATRERLGRRQERNLPFVQADVETGVARIRGLYLAEGFLHSEVDPPVIDFTAGGTRADVTVVIREGIQHRFGEVTFAGEPVFSAQILAAQIGEIIGKPYTKDRERSAARTLEYFFKTKGYYRPEVIAESDPDDRGDGVVPVVFVIKPGMQFRFNGITQQGTERLRPGFLPHRFAQLRGESYNPGKVDKLFRELMQTGLFRTLRIDSEPIEGNLVRLDVTVSEAKARELGFSLGYGSFDGYVLGVRAGERNLFGTGRSLTGSIEVLSLGYTGELVFSDPWILESQFSLRSRLYAASLTLVNYTKNEVGWRTDLRRQFTGHYASGLFLSTRLVNVTSDDLPPADLGPTSYSVTSFGWTQAFDTRDNPLNPRKGWIATSSLEYATSMLSESVDYVRGTVRFSFYQPLGKTLLAFGARGGVVQPLGGTQLPIDERFFNGGNSTVRSFRERRLGPRAANGEPIGGQAFTVFNLEYVVPIWGELQAAVFADAGNLLPAASDFGLSDMRYALGFGLRYALPVGPLRIDYGINPDPRDDEASGAFHFSFGFAF